MAELKSVLNCLANPTFEGHDQRVSVETAPLKGSSAMLVLSLFRLLAARVLRQHADQLDLVPRRYQHRQIRRRGTLDRAQQKQSILVMQEQAIATIRQISRCPR